MGVIRIGSTEYTGETIEFDGSSIYIDGSRIELNEDSDYVFQLKFTDCSIKYLRSEYSVVVEGFIDSAKAEKSVCILGNVTRSSCGNSRFYNTTGMSEYKKAKELLRKRSTYGKRSIIKCRGSFNRVIIRNSDFPVETFVSGIIERAVSREDLYCKGTVHSSRSEENTYISR